MNLEEILNNSKKPPKKLKSTGEIVEMSPEGHEEIVKRNLQFQIRLTASGKYRMYQTIDDDALSPLPVLLESMEEAKTGFTKLLSIYLLMQVNPKAAQLLMQGIMSRGLGENNIEFRAVDKDNIDDIIKKLKDDDNTDD